MKRVRYCERVGEAAEGDGGDERRWRRVEDEGKMGKTCLVKDGCMHACMYVRMYVLTCHVKEGGRG